MVIKSADQQPRLNLGEDISYYAFFSKYVHSTTENSF